MVGGSGLCGAMADPGPPPQALELGGCAGGVRAPSALHTLAQSLLLLLPEHHLKRRNSQPFPGAFCRK